ncbi:hypothetical protein N8J89_23715 [Crossiella sp. CA-258035]|uniref:hypothetical protein n=1 Tax=Crossiella sp. CA-258035 TaxID=2981138 RepID=UPI0024BBFE30|nr:hypothetical protein [Crossiella sp. CA-258035]WHT16139.1 hypothetical protein N8J89_23715 [Crossiella sp. CA-258035]
MDGRLLAFARNDDGGVSTTAQTVPGGDFDRWQDLGGGPGVQDGVSASTDPEGRVEVFAFAVEAGFGVLKRWRRTEPGAALRLDPDFTALEPAGPPTATGGHVVYRLADGNASKIGHTWRTRSGAWVSEVVEGHGGVGPIAAAGNVLYATNRGGVSAARLGEWAWTDLGGLVVHRPAVVVDPSGRTHALALSADGELTHWYPLGGPGRRRPGRRSGRTL